MDYKYFEWVLDLNSIPNVLLFLEVCLVLTMSLYIIFSVKKNKVWLIALPFFSLCVLPILNVGVFNIHTFIDTDVALHKSYLDMLVGDTVFSNDRAFQIYSKVYPPGYHYLLYPFYRMGVTVALYSKFLGIVLSLAVPFLFYYLGLVIYGKKEFAFLSGLFVYILPVWDLVYVGLPRSLGFITFLLTMIFLFRYQQTKSILQLIYLCLSMMSALVIHPLTFLISLFIIYVFLIIDIIFNNRVKEFYRLLRDLSVFLVLTAPLIILIVIGQKDLLELSSWTSMRESGLFIRVPYADMDMKDAISKIGLLPCLLFLGSAFYYYLFEAKKHRNQSRLFIGSLLVLFILGMILFFDKLFFLKAHRFPHFISSLFYLASIPTIKKIYGYLRGKILYILPIIVITMLPAISRINKYIRAEILPYGFHRIGGQDGISIPHPDPVRFEEIMEMAGEIKDIVPESEIIACPIRLGDMLRMYTQRSVTSGHKIGGFVTTYKRAGEVFKQQRSDSVLLYDDPLSLFKKYGAQYFLFEKNELKEEDLMPSGFSILFQTENLILYKCNI